jgi:hypothetical protein
MSDYIDNVMELIGQELAKDDVDFAQEVLDKGYPVTYENEEGLLVEEFPDGKIFHIDVDMSTRKTTYLKQLS